METVFSPIRFLIVSVAVLAAVIVGIALICRGCSKPTDVSDFEGAYYVDDYTAYEFDGKGKIVSVAFWDGGIKNGKKNKRTAAG